MFLQSIPLTRNLAFWSGITVAAAWLAVPLGQADAQTSIMSPGDTIVTGFSGVVPPTPPYPSGNPVDETFINLDGPSMQIQQPAPAGPPAGQLIASPTVFAAPARSVGQVFAITLDDQPVPNIYLGATSAFGLQIVAPDSDGDGRPERITTGQADATFMPGQWGPGGSPGSIYRVDGTTGATTLLTTIGANAGPGLGDVVYDKATYQFFVSDLDTGLIYRLDWTGTILDTFDHGLTGPPTRGQPAVADDGSTMDITSPAFNSEDPSTWGYTQTERMVWGMAVHGGRLYYYVDHAIWSVGVNLNGTFANDPRWEFDIKGLASDNPVSDIVFDGQGRIILAQRGLQRGSYDYSVFAEPAQSSVVRYQREIPDNPTTPSTWVEVPDQYAIGFRPEGHNASGGVALGFGYDSNGRLRTGACFQELWSTGDSLRDNPALATQLAAGGPAVVHGLQGNDAGLVRPQNDPPFSSYFTDYDGNFDDAINQGHVGDVEIWQPCSGYIPPYIPPPTWIPPPRETFNLTIDKRALQCGLYRDEWTCFYSVRVTNTGTAPYWGPVTVEDWLPGGGGATVTFSPEPPWACGPIGADDYSCSYPDVFLFPGEGIDLYVSAAISPNYRPCSLTNAARIVWPYGFGDANPSDDYAYATGQIGRQDCRPPSTHKTNLKIEKSAFPKVCTDTGDNWLCSWQVTVTNEGPGEYDGPITITDTLSSGTPLGWSGPWACSASGSDWSCTHPDVSLGVGDPVVLWVWTTISKGAQVEAQQCSITNRVHIDDAPGGSDLNTDASDDDATDEALTPGQNCEPFGEPTDLSITKTAKGCLPYFIGDQLAWVCTFEISVKNESDNLFFSPISIHDELSVTPMAPSPSFGAAQPFCNDDGTGWTCTTPIPVFIAPHSSPPGALNMQVIIPDDNGQTCSIENTASIVAPTGAPWNTAAGNDSASATQQIPSAACEQELFLKKAPECPVERRKPDGGCCPDGQPWNGNSCGKKEAAPPPKSPAPPPPPPPPTLTPTPLPVCPSSRQIPGDGCCGVGTVWDSKSRSCKAPFVCPADRQMPGGSCCPNGTTWSARQQQCVAPQLCPPNRQIPGGGCCRNGTVWNPKANECTTLGILTLPQGPVVPAVCPADSTGQPPNCRCKPGTHGTPGSCQPDRNVNPGILKVPNNTLKLLACPSDSVGTQPNCTCKRGTHGTPGSCVADTPPAQIFRQLIVPQQNNK